MCSLYLQKVGWFSHSIAKTELCCLWDLYKPLMKSILIISHIHLGSFILWSKPLGFWCSTFSCWKSGHIATNSAMPLFILLHHYTSLKSQYIFMELRLMECLELWISSMILTWSSSTLSKENIFDNIIRHLPLVQKKIFFFFAYDHLPSTQENRILIFLFFHLCHEWRLNPIHHHYSSFLVIH